jgi:hypothetical protein
MSIQLLTHSRIDTFKTCRRKHFFAYEQCIRREVDAKALRMGTAYHLGLETLSKISDIDQALNAVNLFYSPLIAAEPDLAEPFDSLQYEHETIRNLLAGYDWRFGGIPLQYVASEQEFRQSLLNPDTGAPTPIFELAGKIDGIVQLEDQRLAIIEHKLLGEDIDANSQLWRRLRIDHQISMYVYVGRRLGYQVDTVLYNVARKPTIKPTNIPTLDSEGLKIVVDANGDRVLTAKGTPRQTADTEKGYVLLSRPMTPEEWGAKLLADISERPDFYYRRAEVARLDQDIDEFADELWDLQKTIRDAQLHNRHYRTSNKHTCPFCEFFELCSARFDPASALPDGFVRLEFPHPELEQPV